MFVLSVPTRLRAATATLLLCIPFIAIEIAIATRSPVWKLPVRNMAYWTLAFTLICIPLTIWFLAVKRWALHLTGLLALIWIFASTWTACSMKYPPLGFFTLFLLAYFVAELAWLRYELQRSFLDPQLAWYQGLPKPIPGLKCQLVSGEKSLELKVSRIDRDGVFLFSSGEGAKSLSLLSSLTERKKLELILNFRDRQVSCEGTPILSIAKGCGVGIQFRDQSADTQKEVGDFVEILRGQGYV